MNRRSARTSWRPGYLAIVVLLHLSLGGLAGQAAGAEKVADQVAAAIQHAETYYLLSVTEQGDVPASQAALRELEHAEELLQQETLPPAETDQISRHITALKSDLQDQIGVMRRSLEGVFPLTGFLTSSLFADSGPTAIYRLIDDPAIKATKKAAADLVARTTELEKKQAQLPVVFVYAAPPDAPPGSALPAEDNDPDRLRARTLEHAARQMFRGSPQFLVKTHSEVEEALAPAGIEMVRQARNDFRAGHITPAVEERLLQAFRPRLLLVVIQQADTIPGVSYYRLEGRLLDASKARQETFSTFGFGRDRRDRLDWIVWANAALLVIAYAAYALIVYSHRTMAGGRSWTAMLLLPVVAFVVGRTLPYAVSPLLGSIRLPPGTPALASFWIACLAGLGFLAAPLLAYWLASPWFAALWPSLNPGNRGGALFAAMGAGIAAYLAGPMLLYSDGHPLLDVTLMSVIALVLAYLLGRTLDYSDPLPASLALVPLVLAMPAGAALLHAETMGLAIVAGTVVAAGAAIVALRATHSGRSTGKPSPTPSPDDQARMGGIPADAQELARRPKIRTISSFLASIRHGIG